MPGQSPSEIENASHMLRYYKIGVSGSSGSHIKINLRFVGVLVHASDTLVTSIGKAGENTYCLKDHRKLESPANWSAIRQYSYLKRAAARETKVRALT